MVEDDQDDVELFSEALHSINPSVQFNYASNGRDALEKLDGLDQKPEVIFLDINMPVTNG